MDTEPEYEFTVNPELFSMLKKLNITVTRCPRCNSDIIGLIQHNNNNTISQQIYARCNNCDQDIIILLINSSKLNT
jgi:uncharacterized protein with PIN domain